MLQPRENTVIEMARSLCMFRGVLTFSSWLLDVPVQPALDATFEEPQHYRTYQDAALKLGPVRQWSLYFTVHYLAMMETRCTISKDMLMAQLLQDIDTGALSCETCCMQELVSLHTNTLRTLNHWDRKTSTPILFDPCGVCDTTLRYQWVDEIVKAVLKQHPIDETSYDLFSKSLAYVVEQSNNWLAACPACFAPVDELQPYMNRLWEPYFMDRMDAFEQLLPGSLEPCCRVLRLLHGCTVIESEIQNRFQKYCRTVLWQEFHAEIWPVVDEKLSQLLRYNAFHIQIQLAMEHVLRLWTKSDANHEVSISAAQYLDRACRTGLKTHILFVMQRYPDKDAFFQIWLQLTSNRYMTTVISEFVEREMIEQLMQTIGPLEAGRLRDMLQDTCSQEVREYTTDDGMVVQPMIISRSWPRATVDVPDSFINHPKLNDWVSPGYMEYIRLKGFARTVSTAWTVGNAEVDVYVGRETKYRLTHINSLQLSCLLFFNEKPYWTFDELASVMKVPVMFVKRSLHPLATRGRHMGVFTFTKEGARFSTTYKNAKHVIKFPSPVYETVRVDCEDLERQRAFVLQSAIVRCMKTRQSCTLSDLMLDLGVKLTSFPIAAADVKRQVEDLITREYLERDSERLELLKYLA
jgi:hypothetical protein